MSSFFVGSLACACGCSFAAACACVWCGAVVVSRCWPLVVSSLALPYLSMQQHSEHLFYKLSRFFNFVVAWIPPVTLLAAVFVVCCLLLSVWLSRPLCPAILHAQDRIDIAGNNTWGWRWTAHCYPAVMTSSKELAWVRYHHASCMHAQAWESSLALFPFISWAATGCWWWLTCSGGIAPLVPTC